MTPEFEVQMMKFAAGELDDQQESALLLACEVEPALWRNLALAVAEEHRLTGALSAASHAEKVMLAPGAQPTRDAGPTWSTLATAACVALLCGAGLMHLGDRLWSEPQPPEAAQRDPSRQFIVLERPQATPSAHQAANNPLAEALRPRLTQADRDLFRHHGYEVHEQPVLYLVSDEQGKPVAVPQRNVTLARLDN